MPEKVSNNLSRTFHWRKRHWNRLFAKDEVITADLLDTPRPIEENKTGHPSWQENEVVLVDIWGEFLDSRCLQSLMSFGYISIFWRILAITKKTGYLSCLEHVVRHIWIPIRSLFTRWIHQSQFWLPRFPTKQPKKILWITACGRSEMYPKCIQPTTLPPIIVQWKMDEHGCISNMSFLSFFR